LFKLAVIITILGGVKDTEIYRFEIDHDFRAETGCYLAGAVEVAQVEQQLFYFGLPPNVTIEIECK